MEGSITVVVAADEAAVDEHEHVAEGAIDLDPDAAARVAGGYIECAAVPAHAGFRIAPAQRLVTVQAQRIVSLAGIVDERQFDSPVTRRVKVAPSGVIESGLGEFEVAGLAEVALAGRAAAERSDKSSPSRPAVRANAERVANVEAERTSPEESRSRRVIDGIGPLDSIEKRQDARECRWLQDRNVRSR